MERRPEKGAVNTSARSTGRLPSYSLPPSSPARFLSHGAPPLINKGPKDQLVGDTDTLSSQTSGVDVAESSDVADSHLHYRESSGNARRNRAYKGYGPFDESEDEGLLPKPSAATSSNNIYPPRIPHTTADKHPSFRSNLREAHTPVPAIEVFSRSAAPLSIPQLDDYISSLPIPKFSTSAGGRTSNGSVPMFTPMDRLAASGKSLEDLQQNRRVSPAWRNRTTIAGGLVGVVLGALGSSLVSTYYSLHSLFNTVQIFALILNTLVPVGGASVISHWKAVLLGTIPNVLALNFGSTLAQNVALLLFFTCVSGILVFFFHRVTAPCTRYVKSEAFQAPEKSSGWAIIIVTFLLTVIYLPLSTVAVHVITWSNELWVVPNPYINATTLPPIVVPLGPAAEYRDPLDFCWTTTMKKDEVNYAPAIVVVAIFLFSGLTVWFPIALHKVIKKTAPRVDPYTALGDKRKNGDLDLEYSRILDRDRNPLSFIYHGFRRGWASYEAMYLIAKLSALLIIVVIDPHNCLFRTFSPTTVMVVRQCILLTAMVVFFSAQCRFAPFLDPLNNASEWVSRLNYVCTSLVALLLALDVPGQGIIGGPVLYLIYSVTYGFTFYFFAVNTNWVQGIIKRFTLRLDFSIDIFSPRLDLSPSSLHLRRRIWQESISTLVLTNTDCKIPNGQAMTFASSINSDYPSYLLGFEDTPGERHVENLKILREMGLFTYSKALSLSSGTEEAWVRQLLEEIQNFYVGPDCYWNDPNNPSLRGMASYFGNAWLVPFPPTLVMKYDNGSRIVLQDPHDLQVYFNQNSSPEVRRRREVRLALRALDGQIVYWPCNHVQANFARLWFCGSRYRAQSVVPYQTARLSIVHSGYLVWDGLQLGSGFGLKLRYARGVSYDGSIFGVNAKFDLTDGLAKFLTLNHKAISIRLPEINRKLSEYRRHYSQEFKRKVDSLSYGFLVYVYNRPMDSSGLAKDVIRKEKSPRVRQLLAGSALVFDVTFERLSAVSTSEVAVWWYLFWDDLWRRNHETITALRIHAGDFDPHYPTSIAYTPLPRAALETFLRQRGMLDSKPHFVHTGLLNKMYIRMYDIISHGSQKGNIFHYGQGYSELDLDEIDAETRVNPSSLGTGNGTDYDDVEIRQRPYFRWEGIMNDPIVAHAPAHRRLIAKMGAWLGTTPLWRTGVPSPGVALDVRLDGGKYVLI